MIEFYGQRAHLHLLFETVEKDFVQSLNVALRKGISIFPPHACDQRLGVDWVLSKVKLQIRHCSEDDRDEQVL